ncbi:MAG: hypothetical protein K0U98_20105 [Deltaproteobacteria bacterium]|nr:hypothetical protein [Deltaproteobacteria bacterium]
MAITLVLIVFALALVSELLLDSQRLFLRAERETRDVEASVLERRIRLDVQAAKGALATESLPTTALWTQDPLVLSLPEGGFLTYFPDGPELMRAVFDFEGKLQSQRRVAVKVQSWRWRLVADGLLDIELTRQSGEVRTQQLRLALRSVPRSGRW